MSTLKTKIDQKFVLDFLKSNFASDIQSLTNIKEGETAQAFSFSSKKSDFIVRIHSRKHGFEKDEYAHIHFSSKNLPIPKTFKIGKLNDKFFYSITQKSKGKIIDHFKKEEVQKFMPELINTLHSIHNVNIGKTKFGDWEIDGRANEESWNDSLLKLVERYDNYKNEDTDNVLLEEDVVKQILIRYKKLIPYCPNISHLVHGDYGFNNLLSDGKKITGVIDWDLSKYGDFLWDVAWLSFWETKIDYAGIFLKYYKEKKIPVPNFDKRILCCKLNFRADFFKWNVLALK